MTAVAPLPPLRPVQWLAATGTVRLLDQRALPHRETSLDLHTAADVATAIRDLTVRGAPAIGCAAAGGIAAEAARHRDAPPAMLLATLDAAFHVLAASRPTAVNLFWALDRMRATLASHTAHAAGSAQIAIALSDAATALIAEDIAANHRLGDFGATLLADGARVLTHCNAGALATAGHGTALGVIRSAVAAGKRIAVWADETRPVLQGARLTAWELARDGIPVTLLPDGAAGLLMARGAVDAVIVGADRIAANGDTANKVGTFMVALAAARHGIPFHVAAPTSTFDSTRPDGRAIPIEERDADEVRGVGASLVAPRDVAVFNPAFDVTPADLIATIVTEHGVIERPDTARIAAFFAAWER